MRGSGGAAQPLRRSPSSVSSSSAAAAGGGLALPSTAAPETPRGGRRAVGASNSSSQMAALFGGGGGGGTNSGAGGRRQQQNVTHASPYAHTAEEEDESLDTKYPAAFASPSQQHSRQRAGSRPHSSSALSPPAETPRQSQLRLEIQQLEAQITATRNAHGTHSDAGSAKIYAINKKMGAVKAELLKETREANELIAIQRERDANRAAIDERRRLFHR